MYVRFQTGGGAQTLSLGSASASTGELFGNAVAVPLGNRPFYPGKRRRTARRRSATSRRRRTSTARRPPSRRRPGQAALARRARRCRSLRAKLRPFGPRRTAPSDRRSASTGATSWRSSSCSSSRSSWRSFILDNQRLSLPAGVPVLGRDFVTRRGRARDGAGGHAGPGPDGQHRGRRGRRDLEREARERQGRDRAGHRARARDDLPRRHDPPAAQDGAQGHGRRAQPRHPGGRRAAPRASGSRPRRRCPTSTSTRSSPRSTPTRATTSSCCSATPSIGAEGQRPRARADDPALRADRPLRPPDQRAARHCGGRTSGASIHNLSLLMEELGDARRRRSPTSSTARTRCSRRCANQERQHPGDAAGAALDARRVAEGAGQRRTGWPPCSGRRSRTCGRRRARSGRRCARRARS